MQMQILSIDYGEKNIGLAIGDADSKLAVPYGVIKFKSKDYVLERIRSIVNEEDIGRIVIGMSEGEMIVKTNEFGETLAESLTIPIEFHDETLTSADARKLAIEAGIKRSKRKRMEHAYSAALILEGYFETAVKNL